MNCAFCFVVRPFYAAVGRLTSFIYTHVRSVKSIQLNKIGTIGRSATDISASVCSCVTYSILTDACELFHTGSCHQSHDIYLIFSVK